MFSKILRTILVAALLATSTYTAFAKETASYSHREIESWRDQGMVFVVRDASGHIIHHAKGQLERWRGERNMIWVVRDSEGKFLTRAKGSIEKWADGTTRLVLRNKDGKFVAMALVGYRDGRAFDLPQGEPEADLAELQ